MATTITKELFGKETDGRDIYKYILTDEKGQRLAMMNVGCVILELSILDKNGKLQDVVLGSPTPEGYLERRSVSAATVGRCANRINAGKFSIDGVEYQLECNAGPNHLHGGKEGFQTKYWDAEIVDDTVVFSYTSPDGEEGYPGTVKVSQTVSFRDGVFSMVNEYETDKPTIVNLTNHAFFNLNGQDSGTSTTGHTLVMKASKYSVCDDTLLPIGVGDVVGTPYDFLTPHTLGERDDSEFPQFVASRRGYDVNYILDSGEAAAVATGDVSGITMTISTDSPAMQLFGGGSVGTFMKDGKNGATYAVRGGFCLEPHFIPNVINTPDAETVIARPGKKYRIETRYTFTLA